MKLQLYLLVKMVHHLLPGKLLFTQEVILLKLYQVCLPTEGWVPWGDAGWHNQLFHRNHVTLSQYYNFKLSVRQFFSSLFYGKKTVSAICC